MVVAIVQISGYLTGPLRHKLFQRRRLFQALEAVGVKAYHHITASGSDGGGIILILNFEKLRVGELLPHQILEIVHFLRVVPRAHGISFGGILEVLRVADLNSGVVKIRQLLLGEFALPARVLRLRLLNIGRVLGLSGRRLGRFGRTRCGTLTGCQHTQEHRTAEQSRKNLCDFFHNYPPFLKESLIYSFLPAGGGEKPLQILGPFRCEQIKSEVP